MAIVVLTLASSFASAVQPDEILADQALEGRARALSKELRSRGFTFVGPTIAESILQAIGALDGHVPGCAQSSRASRSRSPRTRVPARRAVPGRR